jgi:hemerythrin-like metal-binding protein
VNIHYETTPISWNDSFSVGVNTIDLHHQHLANLINQLAECNSEDLKSEKVVDILSALINYAEYHFNHEEKLMAEIDYIDLEIHRQEHRHFCEVVAETCYGATLGVVGTKELFSYLTRWWRNHILLEDMKYKPFLYLAPSLHTQAAA